MCKRFLNLQISFFSILTKSLLVFLLWLVSPLNALAEGVGCNNTFVQLANDELVIEVARTNTNDTVNIQCALDAAVSMGIATVRLAAGNYFIGALMVENFKGTLEGRTKTSTIVKVLDSSIDCVSMDNAGRYRSAIKFVKGEPRIRFMTITAQDPCISNTDLDTILHFTGDSTKSDNCDNDVIFGAVDRVIIDGSESFYGAWSSIEVAPEGRWLGGCKDTLLGTFKLNRSTLKNTFAGIVSNMKAGAQVDINFNEFRDIVQSVSLFDTNQNTTITTNKFFGDNTISDSYFGVLVYNYSENPPPTSRLVVQNNEFNVASSFTENWSSAVEVDVTSNVSSVVTNNKFNLSGIKTYGVYMRNISNGHVSANNFSGSGTRAIWIGGNVPVTGWTITANTGLASFVSDLTESIRLYSNTSECIVGPGQGATVQDDGTDNTVLPQ